MRIRLLLSCALMVSVVLTGCSSDEGECTGPDCEKACSPACGGSTPVCDSESKTCVTCTKDEGCSSGEVCDTATSKGECVACLSDANCGGLTPICDLASKSCVVCTSAYGCGAGEYCDLSYPGGMCVSTGCNTNTDCNAPTSVCDPTSRKCVVCTALQGCAAGQTCDLSVAGGRCVTQGGCSSSTQCSAPTPVCDISSQQCVVCTATEGCGTNETCDTSVVGGRCVGDVGCSSSGECSAPTPVCDLSTHECVVCTASEGCAGGQICDTTVAGGTCVTPGTCSSSIECSGSTPVCDTGNGQCVVCTATEGCTGGDICDLGVAGGRCIGCITSAQCSAPTAVCDTSINECVVCTATEGCSGAAPKCDVTVIGGQCVQCLTSADCAATPSTPTCSAAHVCVAGQGSASDQIAAARAAADGTGLSLPINGALVTYVKAAVGNDLPGFFLQADQTGPAIFVAVDPATLSPAPAVGDSVDLTVTALDSSVSSIKMATAISGFSRISGGNQVTGLAQDLSATSDVVTNLDAYEAELIRMTGTITGAFGYGGSGHSSAQFSTAGVAGNDSLKLRVADTLKDALGLAQGCSLTVTYGPMWRHNTQAQPSAYAASEITALTCPGPSVVSAIPTAADKVTVNFDRDVDLASVAANGSQFTFDNGLTASAATASGKQVVVTTSAQTPATSYTVTVAASVLDVFGRPVGAQNTASFPGFGGASSSGVVINEIDYDQPSTDDAEFIEVFNGSGSARSLAGLALVLVNGGLTPPGEYGRIDLSAAGSLANGGYLVVHMPGVPVAAGALSIEVSSLSVQNGPDAIVLLDTSNNTVLDALSYEGAITEATLDDSTVINIAEGGAAPTDSTAGSLIRWPNGQDTDDNSVDFIFSSTVTPGAANAQ